MTAPTPKDLIQLRLKLDRLQIPTHALSLHNYELVKNVFEKRLFCECQSGLVLSSQNERWAGYESVISRLQIQNIDLHQKIRDLREKLSQKISKQTLNALQGCDVQSSFQSTIRTLNQKILFQNQEISRLQSKLSTSTLNIERVVQNNRALKLRKQNEALLEQQQLIFRSLKSHELKQLVSQSNAKKKMEDQ